MRLIAIGFAALLLFGVIETLVANRASIHDVVAERNTRHTATCAAIPFLTFRTVNLLHEHEFR